MKKKKSIIITHQQNDKNSNIIYHVSTSKDVQYDTINEQMATVMSNSL